MVFSPRYSSVASIGGLSISGALVRGGVGVAAHEVVSMVTIPFSCFVLVSVYETWTVATWWVREEVGEEVVGGGVFGDRERMGAGDLW